MEDLTNIWSADDELNEEQLLDYVTGKSGNEDAYVVEQKMADSSFVNDGIEGLQQFSSASKINTYVQQINEDLHHRLFEKKQRRKKAIENFSWEIIAITVVIVLCILGYVIIEMMHK